MNILWKKMIQLYGTKQMVVGRNIGVHYHFILLHKCDKYWEEKHTEKIGAPVHGKNAVGGLNTSYKTFLRKKWTVYQKHYHNMWNPWYA